MVMIKQEWMEKAATSKYELHASREQCMHKCHVAVR